MLYCPVKTADSYFEKRSQVIEKNLKLFVFTPKKAHFFEHPRSSLDEERQSSCSREERGCSKSILLTGFRAKTVGSTHLSCKTGPEAYGAPRPMLGNW